MVLNDDQREIETYNNIPLNRCIIVTLRCVEYCEDFEFMIKHTC